MAYGLNRNRKVVYLDEPAKKFLADLKSCRLKAGLTLLETGKLINCSLDAICNYESGSNYPSLERFIRLAELFDYDISESLNYKFYYGEITSEHIKNHLSKYGLGGAELARLTGYDRGHMDRVIHMRPNLTLRCLAAVLEVIEHERNLYKFRKKLLSKTAHRRRSE